MKKRHVSLFSTSQGVYLSLSHHHAEMENFPLCSDRVPVNGQRGTPSPPPSPLPLSPHHDYLFLSCMQKPQEKVR